MKWGSDYIYNMKLLPLFLTSLCALMACAAPVYAQDGPSVLLDSSVCAEGARYQPGIDVRGKPVAPADLDDADMGDELMESINVTLKLDIAQKLGIPTQMLTGEAQIGTITRAENGDLLLNGKKLSRPSAVEIAALCQQGSTR